MQDPLEALKASLKASIAAHGKIKDTRRTIRKIFYVSPEEDQQIAHHCQGGSQSRYFRTKVLGKNIPRSRPVTPQINRQTYVLLAHMRRDIKQASNQITLAVSQGQTSSLTPSDLEIFTRLEAQLGDIQQQLNLADSQTGDNHDDWQNSPE